MPAPLPADRGILLIPEAGEAVQRGLGLLQGNGPVYSPEIPGHLLAVLPGHVGQAVAHHVDDAELHLGPGVYRLYGLRKARQAIAAGDEDVSNAPVLQFGEHVEPELRAFVLLDPQAQEFLVAFQVDAQGQVDRLVPDAAAIAYLDEQGIQEQDRVDLIHKPRLPGHHLVGYGVGDPRDQFGRDGHPVDIFDMALDIPGAHAPGVHGDDLVIEVRPTGLILADQLRFE